MSSRAPTIRQGSWGFRYIAHPMESPNRKSQCRMRLGGPRPTVAPRRCLPRVVIWAKKPRISETPRAYGSPRSAPGPAWAGARTIQSAQWRSAAQLTPLAGLALRFDGNDQRLRPIIPMPKNYGVDWGPIVIHRPRFLRLHIRRRCANRPRLVRLNRIC